MSPASENPLPLAGVRLAYADDDPVTRTLYAGGLRRAGAEVAEFENGVSAVPAALRAEDDGRPFDAVLLDYAMPVWDGSEAAYTLRASRYSGAIIGLTGGVDADERERWLRNGCEAVLDKRLRPREAAARIADIVFSRRLGADDGPDDELRGSAGLATWE